MAGENPILDRILELQARKQEMVSPVQVKNKPMTPAPLIQDNVAGDQVNGIPKKPVDGLNFNSKSEALLDAFQARASTINDPLAASRLHTFNASRAGYNYDRYYEHGKFKELGFSTRRNNEDIYTSKSSFSDDFGRMFGKLGSMIYAAGTEQFKNWGKFGTNGDLEAAALQEHNMSIAQSNREGFGAWTTNFISNSAYTLGIAAEIAVEELALLSLTAATGTGAAPLAAARTATNIGRLSKSIGQMVKLFNNADKAKSFWTATKGFGANVGRAIMPFEETFLLAKEAANPNSKFHRLSNLAKTTRTFGAFYRGMKEINAVTSESRLESAFAQSDFLDKATEEFRKKEGRDPNPQEMQGIFERSKKAGTAAFYSNVPLIYFSNKVVLDGALKGFRPLDDVIRRASSKGTFYSIGRNAKTGMAELVENGFKMPKFSLSGVKQIPSRFGKIFSKQRGLQTLGSTVKYFRANLMEGLQESGQEIVAGTVNDYYLQEYYADLYKDPFIAEHNLVSSSFSKAVESQFSSEGLDIFLSGFLMGGPMQKINNLIFNKGSLAATKISDWRNKTNKYEEYKKREKESFQAQVDAINYVEQNKTEVAKALERNLIEQRNLNKDYEDSMAMNDRHGAENAKDQMLFNHIYTLLRTNNYDSFLDILKDLKTLDKKDLQDAFTDSTVEGDVNNKDIYSRLDSVIGKAENIKERYEAGMKEENPFNPSMIDAKTNPEAYAEEKLYHQLFEQARMASIFSEYSFDRASKRYQSLLNKFADIDYIKNLDPIYVQSLLDRELQTLNVNTIKSEIAALKMGDESDKAKAKEKEEYLQELTSTIAEINKYRSSYAHMKRAERNPDEYGKLKERADTFMPYVEVVDDNGQINMLGEVEPDVRLDMYHKEQLEKAMMKYLSLLAKMNNAQFKQSDAESTIAELMDLVKLDTDAQYNLTDINNLRDPYALLRLTQRLKSAHDKIKGKEAELRAEAVLQFNQMAVQDDFLQWMADNGLFFDPDLLKDFLENNQLPKHFIDASTGNKVTPSDPRYQKIIDKLNEIEQLTGRTFSGKPVPVKPEAETQVKEAAPTATPKVVTDYTIMTPFDNLPDEVKVLLQAEYDKTSKTLPIDEWKQNSPEAAAIIQNTKVKQPAAETVSDIISDDVYNAFVDKNIVPENILNSIADKVMNNVALSPRETAIFNGRTSDVNRIIVEKTNQSNAQQEKTRNKNVELINQTIDLLEKRKLSSEKNIGIIKDTLGYLKQLLDNTIDLSSNETNRLLNAIKSLESLIESNSARKTKRGKSVSLTIDGYKKQLKSERQLLNDIADRIRTLTEELNQLEQINKDLTNQINYYRNLIVDKNFKELNETELRNKIEAINKKKSVIERLISTLRHIIRKSIAYLKEYFSLTTKSINALETFKKNNNFKKLNTEELKELLKDPNTLSTDQYFELQRIFDQLEKDVNANLDNVELLETAKEKEKQRLDDLYQVLQKYNDQIRYINNLLDVYKQQSKSIEIGPSTTGAPKAETKVSEKKVNNKIQQTKEEKTKAETTPIVVAPTVTPVVTPPTVQPKPAEPTATVSDIKAKKADIERRRREELNKSDSLPRQKEDGNVDQNIIDTYVKDEIGYATEDDINEGDVVINNKGQVARIRKDKNGKFEVITNLNTQRGLNRTEVFEYLQRQKFRKAKVESTFDAYAELDVLEGTKQTPVTQSKEPVSTATASEYPAELAPLFEKRLGVGPDNNSYVLLDENNNPLEGSPEWMRVTRFIDSGEEVSIAREYSDRGLVIDELLRLFFSSKPMAMGSQSFQDVIKNGLKDRADKEEGYPTLKQVVIKWVEDQMTASLSKLQKNGSKLKITSDTHAAIADTLLKLAEEFKNYDWYSDVPTLYGTINGQPVAGTIDLLFVKDGKYYIIDSKTSNVNRKLEYQDEESIYKEKDTLQQNVYAELLRQMTGGKVDADVYILPVQMPVISNTVSSFTPSLSERNKKVVVTIKLDKLSSEELSERLGGVAPTPVERRAVPETFRGKIIYAIPGTVDPEVYNTYDIVNADDVLAQVLKDRGIEANPLNAGAIAYKSADREGIYTEFIERLQGMTKEGKTVISSNIVFLLRPSTSNLIFSLPSAEKAFNKKTYEDAVSNQGTLNNLLQDFVREGESKTKYGSPVMQMLGIEEEKNEILDDFLRSDTVAGLKTHIHSYFTATENLKDMYHILDAGGNKIVMTSEVFENQVISLLDNLEKQDKIDKSDKKEVMDLLNSYVKKPESVGELTEEEIKEANKVAENAIDFVDNPEAVNKALESADKEDKGKINDDFLNNLDCE